MTDERAVGRDVEAAGDLCRRAIAQLERVVVGKRTVLENLLAAMLADGHVLIEDVPGLAKTLMARSFATVLGLSFGRVQFTPDLMPADVTGSSVLDQAAGELVFRPGPLFANLVLADEINRAPTKTQAALLEAMEERQVTADGVTHRLPRPFLVVATQNPIEYEGTYPLPEAQLDRFLARLSVGYPDLEAEVEMVDRRLSRQRDLADLDVVARPEDLLSAQQTVEGVHVAPSVRTYLVALVRATREHPQVEVGASPRGSLALVKLARARALIEGRDHVLPDDVKAVARPALAHRMVLRPEVWIQGVGGEQIVAACLNDVPAPAPEELVARPPGS